MSTSTLAITVDEFLRDFTRELEEENAAIFAGAGLSVDAGFVNWKQLLEPFAKDLGLNVERETDLVRLAQFHHNRYSNRSALNKAIFNEFAAKARVTRSHEILAGLPIRTYWTTNYDTCIEDALRQAGKLPDVKYDKDQLPNTMRNRDAVVYKMHGDHQHSSKAVLTKQDYERYHLDRGEFLTALNGDLVSKTFLFIGFSFTDPNLEAVLSRLHATYGEHQRSHYCFVKEESSRLDDKDGDLDYRKAWQEHFIRDLQRYSIRAVKIQEYSEVPEILAELAARYKRKTVFISGAAHEYGSHPQADALQYVFDLSSGLIKEDYRVVTGFGLGIGSSVVNGALHQIYKVLKRRLKDELVLRPFPQGGPAATSLWTDYRKDMLDMSGIAVYMFGNKLVPGHPDAQRSNGIEEEFDIAVVKGVKVLPLGFTGYVARELYDRVEQNFPTFYPKATQQFRNEFILLGDSKRSLSDQLQTTLSAIKILQTM
jgi:hypothetical protein